MDFDGDMFDARTMEQDDADSRVRCRPTVELTVNPRRRCLVDMRIIDGNNGDAGLFLIVRDALFPYLHQRRLDENQSIAARQALDQSSAILACRHSHLGYVFSWQDARGQTYYLAIRETDKLTKRLDRERSAQDEHERRARLRRRRSA